MRAFSRWCAAAASAERQPQLAPPHLWGRHPHLWGRIPAFACPPISCPPVATHPSLPPPAPPQLGVQISRESPVDEARKAYRGLARLLHPDKLGRHFPGATKAFQVATVM